MEGHKWQNGIRIKANKDTPEVQETLTITSYFHQLISFDYILYWNADEGGGGKKIKEQTRTLVQTNSMQTVWADSHFHSPANSQKTHKSLQWHFCQLKHPDLDTLHCGGHTHRTREHHKVEERPTIRERQMYRVIINSRNSQLVLVTVSFMCDFFSFFFAVLVGLSQDVSCDAKSYFVIRRICRADWALCC